MLISGLADACRNHQRNRPEIGSIFAALARQAADL
jgi:hypothetical protein